MSTPRESDGPDDDAVFREIVAQFAAEPDEAGPVPRWPVSEDVTPRAAQPPPEVSREPAREVESLPAWLEPEALEDEGHYEPPAPPRLPRPRLRTVIGVLVLVAGFAVLFVPFRIGFDDSPGSLLLGMGLVVGGVAVLVTGMRDAPPADDRPDGGAVV